MYIPKDEQEAAMRAWDAEVDVIKRQAMEDEKRMEWRLAVMREKKRRVDVAAEAAEELEEVKRIEEQLAAQTELPAQMRVIARNVARLARIQAKQYDFSRSQHIAVRLIRLGSRDFARELVGAVGAEVGHRLDKTERFCAGAIEGVKAAAPKEEEPRPPPRESVKVKFPDSYTGKREENFDNWEANVKTYVHLQEVSPNQHVFIAIHALRDEAASFARYLVRAANCNDDAVTYSAFTSLTEFMRLLRERFADVTRSVKASDRLQTIHAHKWKSARALKSTMDKLIVVPDHGVTDTQLVGLFYRAIPEALRGHFVAKSEDPATTYDSLSHEVVAFEAKSASVSTFWHKDLDKGKQWKGRIISGQVKTKDSLILTLDEGSVDEIPYDQIEWGLEEEGSGVGQGRTYAALAVGGRPQGGGRGQGQGGRASGSRFQGGQGLAAGEETAKREEGVKVLEKLREVNFKINAKKCDWAKTQVLYLGHVLDGDDVKPEDSKIAAIRDWPTPRTLTELRSFLGLANYYRKFVRNFSTIAAPLRRLLRKETIWKWDKDCTTAMKKLKQTLIEYPVLKVADPSLPFVVTTDASQYGIGAVLQQDDGNGYRPVEFMSARMPSKKVATSTYERELYALKQSLDHWKHYLLGRHFKSLFERLQANDHPVIFLSQQYRMHPEISHFPAQYFYKAELCDAPIITMRPQMFAGSLCVRDMLGSDFKFTLGPYRFLDVDWGQEQKSLSKSMKNKAEVEVVVAIAKALQNVLCTWQGSQGDMGIITPYVSQKNSFVKALQDCRFREGQLEINTVDGFQGREKDVVIVSSVRSSTLQGIGFLSNPRRMNVSLTRARHCLILVGNARTLSNHSSAWRSLIQDARERGCYEPVQRGKVSLPSPVQMGVPRPDKEQPRAEVMNPLGSEMSTSHGAKSDPSHSRAGPSHVKGSYRNTKSSDGGGNHAGQKSFDSKGKGRVEPEDELQPDKKVIWTNGTKLGGKPNRQGVKESGEVLMSTGGLPQSHGKQPAECPEIRKRMRFTAPPSAHDDIASKVDLGRVKQEPQDEWAEAPHNENGSWKRAKPFHKHGSMMRGSIRKPGGGQWHPSHSMAKQRSKTQKQFRAAKHQSQPKR
ncbi:hypothetical protein CBR_g53695 [Chara braunii]|uniref:DNA2/NAM7 helicase-like C-terminal domain-containing protein n=1 Tax=Chara braunii TaxID=69332 RepID=A0A388MB68_CHABU|nr:hypothetical protein CBR_g53695 [Chara braunii]|eukprot:GBG91806.1 hypothetical protein CBR_g53695 [Chara braunii]